MSSGPRFTITYWGVTGTFAAPLKPSEVTAKLVATLQHLAEHQHLQELAALAHDAKRLQRFLEQTVPFHLRSSYGGNTTCVEVQTPDALIIVDCGSGFRELGMMLAQRWASGNSKREAHVLVTHPHMDHTFGTPYFDPYVDPRNHFTLYGSASVMTSLDAVLSPTSPLSSTYFPPTFELLKALRQCCTIEGGKTFAIGATAVKTLNLRHPGGCLGYRLECGGRSFVFCTDHEHVDGPDARVADFARGADLLYLDGQYLAAEYEGRTGIMGEAPQARRGWGHSSVESCIATAVAAGVRTLHVGHREPKRDDSDLARLEEYAKACLAKALREAGRDPQSCSACIPCEGLTLQL
jgi:phosphoribosyl 1,2-cyclic phosphodiesterase